MAMQKYCRTVYTTSLLLQTSIAPSTDLEVVMLQDVMERFYWRVGVVG